MTAKITAHSITELILDVQLDAKLDVLLVAQLDACSIKAFFGSTVKLRLNGRVPLNHMIKSFFQNSEI